MDQNRLDEMSSAFMASCVLGAAAELDVFSALGRQRLDGDALASRLGCDPRATRVLLDALAALGLVEKRANLYAVPDALRPLLCEDQPANVLPGLRHRMNMLRSWSRLAWVVRSGTPAAREPSIRGAQADHETFIAAMHCFSSVVAAELVGRLGPPKFDHLLDVGGASGTWTMAFLDAVPTARATLFDLPEVIDQARRRLAGTRFADRVALVAGNFYEDDLPRGADFAWLSAIAHQHSRQHNRRLLAKVFAAVARGGRVAIRDVVMEPSRIAPAQGALFAVNMLVATESGGTFTLAELAEDLLAAGFVEPTLAVKDEGMSSVVIARRP